MEVHYKVTAKEGAMCEARGLTIVDRDYHEATVACHNADDREIFWACRLAFLRQEMIT